jgi:hypothetical protein
MSKELKIYLTTALAKLQADFQKTCSEQGYSDEAAQIKILIEMIKEQIGNETVSY